MDDRPAVIPPVSQPDNGNSPLSSHDQAAATSTLQPAEQPATQQQLDKVGQQMSAFERSTLSWARAAVLLSGLAALFVCAQWYEMHTGGQDTHALADAAGKQATKMSDMSDAAEKIRNASENMVTQEQRIADKTGEAMQANNRQSAAVLRESTQASHLEQRAGVGAVGFYEPKNLAVGEEATWRGHHEHWKNPGAEAPSDCGRMAISKVARVLATLDAFAGKASCYSPSAGHAPHNLDESPVGSKHRTSPQSPEER